MYCDRWCRFAGWAAKQGIDPIFTAAAQIALKNLWSYCTDRQGLLGLMSVFTLIVLAWEQWCTIGLSLI